MVSDIQIRLAGASMALGFGLAIALTAVSLVIQTTTLVLSDTFLGRAPGIDYLNESLRILGDYAELIQSLGLTRALSLILVIFGILALERAMRDGSAGGSLRGLGALAMLIATVLLVAGLGFGLVSVHTLSLGEASGSESEMELARSHAEALSLAASGMGTIGALVALVGSSALHLGLSSRSMFRHSSTISMIVGIVSILTLLLLVFANYVSSLVIQVYTIANILAMAPRLWLLFIGVMMYRKGSEILEDS